MQTKTISAFLTLVLFPVLIFAQSQTLRGTIIDKQSETPLIGATVQLLNLSADAAEQAGGMGAVSDIDGHFTIKNVPVGRQALRVSATNFLPRFSECNQQPKRVCHALQGSSGRGGQNLPNWVFPGCIVPNRILERPLDK